MQRRLLLEIPHRTWSQREIDAFYTPEYVDRLLAKAQANLRSMIELAHFGLAENPAEFD